MRLTVPLRVLRPATALSAALAFCSFSPREARAQQLASFDVSTPPAGAPLGLSSAYLEDPTSSLSLEDLSRPEGALRFRPVGRAVPSFGFTPSSFWLRATLRNNADRPARLYLEVDNPRLDTTFFVPGDTALRDALSTQPLRAERISPELPFSARTEPHRNPLVSITLAARAERTVYLRGRARLASIPLRVWDEARFREYDARYRLVLGMFYGALLVLAAYNLFLAFATRSRSYLYYVAYVMLSALFFATNSGLSFQHLWPTLPAWNDRSNNFIACALFGVFVLFSRAALELPTESRKMARATQLLSLLSLPGMALALVPGLAMAARYANLYGGLCALTVLALAVALVARKRRHARFFLSAFALLLTGALVWVLQNVGILPRTTLTLYGVQFGAVLESTVLSFLLADRINTLREARDTAARSEHEARAVQDTLLPVSLSIPGFELAALYRPAELTGGDWYGCYHLTDAHRAVFLVGDVTGHGLPSALITAVVTGATYAETSLEASSSVPVPEDIGEHVLRIVHTLDAVVRRSGSRSGRNMTLAALVVDLATGSTAYVSAGHTTALQRDARGVRPITARGTPLGASATPEFSVVRAQLAPSDAILLYTDGILERTGPDRAAITLKSLRDRFAVLGDPALPLEALPPALMSDAEARWKGAPLVDDVTIFALRLHALTPRLRAKERSDKEVLDDP